MTRHLALLLPSMLTLLVANAGGALAQSAPPGGDRARGKILYDTIGCFECHGHAGQGGFAPAVVALRLPYVAFASLVRSPANNMPAYSDKVLSAQELQDLYAFVSSLPGPRKTLPALLRP